MTTQTMEKRVIMDTCIYCGKETNEELDKPVDLRFNYVDGAGQLCPDCYYLIYKED